MNHRRLALIAVGFIAIGAAGAMGLLYVLHQVQLLFGYAGGILADRPVGVLVGVAFLAMLCTAALHSNRTP